MRFKSQRQSKIVSASSPESPLAHNASIVAAQAMFKKHSEPTGDNVRLSISGPPTLNSNANIDALVDPVSSLQLSPGVARLPKLSNNRKTIHGIPRVRTSSRTTYRSPSRHSTADSAGVEPDEEGLTVAAMAAVKAVQFQKQPDAICQQVNTDDELQLNSIYLLPPVKSLRGSHYRSSSNASSMSVITGGESHASFDKIVNTIRANEPLSHIKMEATVQQASLTPLTGSQKEPGRFILGSSNDSLSMPQNQSRLIVPPILVKNAQASSTQVALYTQHQNQETQSMVSYPSDLLTPESGTDLAVDGKRKSLSVAESQSVIVDAKNIHNRKLLRRIPPPVDYLDNLLQLKESSSTSSPSHSVDDRQDSCGRNGSDSINLACLSEPETDLDYSDADIDYGDYDDFANLEGYINLHETLRRDDSDLDDANPIESENDGSTECDSEQSDHTSPAKEFTVSNVSYSTLNKIPMHLTYRGTLPDLIPNYQRKSSKWSKLFRGYSRHGDSDASLSTPSSRIYAQDDSALIQSKHHVRLRTTMRGILTDNATSDAQHPNDDSDESADDSGNNNPATCRPSRRSGKRRERIKNNLRYRGTFNEDKPWKSHLDVGYVTARERKRYEGMWVSNRDSYLELLPWWEDGGPEKGVDIPEDGLMLNLIVADIWSRSNLPQDTLSQIYDMVDTRHDCTLDRNSFVVGMWLVDQSLYGRKLPRELDARVWDSVDKYVINVSNSNKHLKHHHRTRKKMLKKELKLIKKESKAYQI